MKNYARLSLPIAILSVGQPAPAADTVRYLDAHSHLATVMTADEEIERLRRTGLDRVIIMSPEPDKLRQLVARYPGFVIPFLSVARTPEVKGTRLDAAAPLMAQMLAAGEICGFGEVPSRVVPENEPSEAAAVDNAYRRAIYAAANASGVPVNLHVSLSQPETVAAIARIATAYPRMKLILAHAGWDVGPEVLAPLLAAHRNLYADLSVRLDRPRDASQPGNSIVQPDATLQPAWAALIGRFPDRFLFGLDIGLAQRPLRIAELAADARATLGRLPRATEERVAHGNIERLLKTCRLATRPRDSGRGVPAPAK